MNKFVIFSAFAFAPVLVALLYKGGILNLYYKDMGFYLRLPSATRKKRRGR